MNDLGEEVLPKGKIHSKNFMLLKILQAKGQWVADDQLIKW
jgi:hypothetical protein